MRNTQKLLIAMTTLALAGLGCESTSTTEAQDRALALEQEALSLGNGMELDIDFDYGRLNFEETFTSDTGHTIRYKLYQYLGNTEAYVIFLNGRTEFIEKYEPLFTANYDMDWETSAAQTLADLPITFIAMDHEGQGKSGGLKSHIDSYDTFVANLDAVIERLGLENKKCGHGKKHRKPVYLMSHSMGGLIAARYAQAHPENVDGLILSSPMFGINAPQGFTSAQLRDLADAYTFGFGFADRCSRAIDPQVLGLIAMCQADPSPENNCGVCFRDPSQASCFFAPYNMPLDANTMTALRGAWSFLSSEAAIGCIANRTPEASCTFPGAGFNGTTSNFEYCMWTENNPIAGPNPTFGWLSQSFKAIDDMNANLGVISDLPTLVLSTPIDPIVTASSHGAFCGQLSDCTLVELQSNWATGPVYFHELLAETDRAAAVTAIRGFLTDKLGL